MKTCTIDGCNNKHKARGWCHTHYERWRNTGDPLSPSRRGRGRPAMTYGDTKKCGLCTETKPIGEYYSRPDGWVYKNCKKCVNAKRIAKRIEQEITNPTPPKPKRAVVSDNPCSYNSCTNQAKSHYLGTGPWCTTHYMQLSRGVPMQPVDPGRRSQINEDVRRCTGCARIKPQGAFYTRRNGGAVTRCRECAGLISKFHNHVRAGRVEQALSLAESMPERLKNKYVDMALTLFNEGRTAHV